MDATLPRAHSLYIEGVVIVFGREIGRVVHQEIEFAASELCNFGCSSLSTSLIRLKDSEVTCRHTCKLAESSMSA